MDSTLYLNDVSTNNKYGFSPYHPVKLGITNLDLASTYPDMYFNAMTGPKGETLNYKRVKSCCPFKTINSPKNYENVAVIEVYEINYTGLDKPIPVYVNFFDQGKVMALKGFKIKNLKK